MCAFVYMNEMKPEYPIRQALQNSVAMEIIDGCGLSNELHHEFLPKESQVMLYSPSVLPCCKLRTCIATVHRLCVCTYVHTYIRMYVHNCLAT